MDKKTGRVRDEPGLRSRRPRSGAHCMPGTRPSACACACAQRNKRESGRRVADAKMSSGIKNCKIKMMKLQLSSFQRPTIYSECVNSNDRIDLQLLLNCYNGLKVSSTRPLLVFFTSLLTQEKETSFVFNITIACLFPG